MRAWLVFFVVPALAAGHASHQAWLGGALPYATVPYYELDAGVFLRSSAGSAGAGAVLQYGITDHWMLGLEAGGGSTYSPPGNLAQALVTTRLRLGESEAWVLDPALYAQWDWRRAASETSRTWLGLVLGRELGEHSFGLDLGLDQVLAARLRLGYRSPYVLWMLRLAGEADYDGPTALWQWMPQLELQLPGDLSIRGGYQFTTASPGAGAAVIQVTYEMFPTP